MITVSDFTNFLPTRRSPVPELTPERRTLDNNPFTRLKMAGHTNIPRRVIAGKNPDDFLMFFFSTAIFNGFIEGINSYAASTSKPNWNAVSLDELKAFFALVMLLGLTAFPRRTDFVSIYNTIMGGTDLWDQLIAAYQMQVRTRRWQTRITSHLLGGMVVNANILYKQTYNLNRNDDYFS